jgi:hypothetical protein
MSAKPAPAVNGAAPPGIPGSSFVREIGKQSNNAHAESMKRLANFTVPAVGGSAESGALDDTIEQFRAHASTISVFADIFAMFQQKRLSREELDQRLLNWGIQMPGLKEAFEDLPPSVHDAVLEFIKADLNTLDGSLDATKGFKIPMNLATAKKCDEVKAEWEKQLKADLGGKYPTVVENNGDPVPYVENYAFVNWGQTSRSTPAV